MYKLFHNYRTTSYFGPKKVLLYPEIGRVRVSVENLTGYDDIVCEFNLIDRVVNFSRLYIRI